MRASAMLRIWALNVSPCRMVLCTEIRLLEDLGVAVAAAVPLKGVSEVVKDGGVVINLAHSIL